MKNRLKQFISRFMIASLIIVSIISTSYAGTELSSDKDDVTLNIRSYLMTSKYVTLPSINFKYVSTIEGVNNGSKNVKEDGIPNLTNIGKENGDILYYKNCANGSTCNNYQTYLMESDNIIPSGSSYSHAGEYVYTLTETQNNNTDYNSMLTYSKAKYELHVFVVNSDNGLRVSNVYVNALKKDDGTTTSGKVEIGKQETNTFREGDFSFTNYLIPLNESLSISNKVSGDYANMSKAFTYGITISNPTYVANDETRKYYGLVVDTTTLKPSSEELIEFTSGEMGYCYMKNNEKLVFVKNDYEPDKDTAVTADALKCLPGGLYYQVIAAATDGYTASGTVTHGGVTENKVTGKTSTAFEIKANTFVDIGTNKTDIETQYRTVVPTGIDDAVAPFMLLLFFSGIALLTGRNRKRDEVK